MHAAFCMSSRTIADRPRIPIPAAAGRRPAWWSVGSAPKQRMAQCGKAIKICAFSAVCTDISQHKPHRCRWGSCILRGWGLHPSIIAVTCRGGGPTGKAHPVRVGGRQAGVGKVAGGRGGRRGPGSGRVVLYFSYPASLVSPGVVGQRPFLEVLRQLGGEFQVSAGSCYPA